MLLTEATLCALSILRTQLVLEQRLDFILRAETPQSSNQLPPTTPPIEDIIVEAPQDPAQYGRKVQYTDFWDLTMHFREYLKQKVGIHPERKVTDHFFDLMQRRKEKNGGIFRRRKSRKD